MKNIFSNFLPSSVITCLDLAQNYAISQHHFEVTMEHIVYGILSFINENVPNKSRPSYFIAPKLYLKKAQLDSVPKATTKDLYIANDLVKFSNIVSKNFLLISNVDDFYWFIAYLKISNFFENDIYMYVPRGSSNYLDKFYINTISIDSHYKSFHSSQYESDILETISSIENTKYNDEIEIEYTTDITYCVKNFPEKYSVQAFVGRSTELNKLINILSKRNRNNPVLLGNPGVGKSSIIYNLAKKIISNSVPHVLKNYHILELDIALTLSGSRYRGDFEEKVTNIINEINKFICNGTKIAIYINDISSIVSAGNSEGAISMASLLKPILANGKVPVIGTSTFAQYRKIEQIKELECYFDTITVNEPSEDETLKILNSHYSFFLSKHHNVRIDKEAFNTIYSLSERYIPSKFQPDKSLDLLDTVCSMVSNRSFFDIPTISSKVTPEDVYSAVSEKTGIPVQKIHDGSNLFNLENQLSSKIIGQKHVIKALASAIRRTKAGLNDETKPLLSALFAGPTGVGKTETAKALADVIFSGKNNIIRFDMSEYMDEHSISKLIGSPPGYIGYENAGLLTEQVKRNPYSLVLFDEFEKAHPKVCNLLLQVLDEGQLTDARGEHINFRNTIIILTSNVGVSDVLKPKVGFFADSYIDNDIVPTIKKYFSPEFFNRLDEVLQFSSLSPDEISQIAKIYVSNIIKKAATQNIQINISDDVLKEVASIGYSKEYGARELSRTIDKLLKTPLADFILLHPNVKYITIGLNNNKITIDECKANLLQFI